MRKIFITLVLISSALLAGGEKVDKLISKLEKRADSISSFKSDIKYTIKEDNGIFKTQTEYSGRFSFYRNTKDGKKREKAAVVFLTKKKEDGKAKKEKKRYVFNGVWLVKFDYPLKQVSRLQLAPENEPMDTLDLLAEDFPLVGFGSREKLKKDYQIKLIEENDKKFTLSLKPNKKSDKKKELIIEIDKELLVPQKITARLKDESETMHISFSSVKIDGKIEKKDFSVETPQGFSENIKRLEKTGTKSKEEKNG
ncbi:LolA family protein [Sedimentisphaera salicampi]|uniref:LolA family protein n=1 Tax=Sedimentisphaera salicampi TaxID=1941349 RepID=UPI000B9A3B67|nr:outer-membrane lipoprotein carrier protein LolA [Sedimentisphaera salicampi]OXU15396.1 lipoprotein chaperone [Sedimentisphaera salicampi]